MTTFYNYQTPQPGSTFSFQPSLDGNPYTAAVPYLLFGQRKYLSLQALDGTLVFYRALVGSPPGIPLSSLSWDVTGLVDAITNAPHGYEVGKTVQLSVSGCAPAAYDGVYKCLITGPSTFTYPLAAPPGNIIQLGQVSQDLNLAWGYFQTSTLVWRPSTMQFETVP